MLNILWGKVPGDWFLLKESLKDIALASVAENFNIEEFQAFSLPQSLAGEIITRKTPWIWNATSRLMPIKKPFWQYKLDQHCQWEIAVSFYFLYWFSVLSAFCLPLIY